MRSKHIPIIISVLVLTNLVLAWQVYAQMEIQGILDSPAPPASTYSFTLEDIYKRLADGTQGTQKNFTEPSSGPTTGTMHSLNEIMDMAPAGDPSGAAENEVVSGKTYWSLRPGATSWGQKTGSMPNRGAVTYTPGTGDQAVAAGYHNGSGKVVGDPELQAGNIAQGVNLFGVDGSAVVATGNAVQADVLAGKTFSKTGATGLTGNMPNNGAVTYTPGTTDQAVAAGYHNGSGKVVGDADLVAGNIKKGVNLFGVNGSLYGASVPKTGQTASHATGDDGDLQRGVAWPSPRFTDNGNGTVTDNLTGLIWLKNANCFGARTWAQALTDAAGLSTGSCGLSDGSIDGAWRLPQVRELQSVVNYGTHGPALPSGHPFTNVQTAQYWSNTNVEHDLRFAWYVEMDHGVVNGANKTAPTSSVYVWPVRGGQ